MPIAAHPTLPYFDFILALIAQANPAVEKSFGRHVHFGFWSDPASARGADSDFAQAAEQLSVELCQAGEITSGERVLDAGCGFGGTLAFLNERHHDMRLVGLNLESRQLDRARQLIQPTAGNVLELHQGDACALPFADASFDRVLAVECIFHFPSRARFLSEAFRVLPGRHAGAVRLRAGGPVPAACARRDGGADARALPIFRPLRYQLHGPRLSPTDPPRWF
jgi:SAM-dependent methyltransferase